MEYNHMMMVEVVVDNYMEVEEEEEEEEREGCVTPKHEQFQIPVAAKCPPPPRKKPFSFERKKIMKKKRQPPKNGYFQSPDLELFLAATSLERRQAYYA